VPGALSKPQACENSYLLRLALMGCLADGESGLHPPESWGSLPRHIVER
jgi:hypothetical protein